MLGLLEDALWTFATPGPTTMVFGCITWMGAGVKNIDRRQFCTFLAVWPELRVLTATKCRRSHRDVVFLYRYEAAGGATLRYPDIRLPITSPTSKRSSIPRSCRRSTFSRTPWGFQSDWDMLQCTPVVCVEPYYLTTRHDTPRFPLGGSSVRRRQHQTAFRPT